MSRVHLTVVSSSSKIKSQRLMEDHLAPKQPVQVNKSLLHARFVVVPMTLNIALKILSKLLLIMRPRVLMKWEGKLIVDMFNHLHAPLEGKCFVTTTSHLLLLLVYVSTAQSHFRIMLHGRYFESLEGWIGSVILGMAWYKANLLKGKFCFIQGDDYISTSGEALAL
ncbi:hypothetical protein Tco_1340799 [Tanacetum coccineum]